MLSTSILLLSPLSIALSVQDTEFSVNIGSRSITIGNRRAPDTTLLGNDITSSTTEAVATTTAVSHSTPTTIIEGGVLIPFEDIGIGIKLALEAQFASSKTHNIYDSTPKTATIIIDGYGASIDDNNPGRNEVFDYDGSVGISSIVGGQRSLTVTHQATVGAKALYVFGDNAHGAGLGFSALVTKDRYKYTVDLNPSGTRSGVFSATALGDDLFPLGGFTDTISSPATIAEANRMDTATYTPTAGTVGEYNDTLFWFGTIAEASAEVNENIAVKGGLGYYIKQFEASINPNISAPMVVTKTNAYMYVGHVGVTVKATIL